MDKPEIFCYTENGNLSREGGLPPAGTGLTDMRRNHDYMMRSEKRPGQTAPRPVSRKSRRRKREKHVGYAIVTLLLLLVLFPIGLILLWVPKLKWRGGTKLLVTIATAPVFFILMAFALTAPSDDPMVVNAQARVRTALTEVTQTISAHLPETSEIRENLTVRGPQIVSRAAQLSLEGAKAAIPAIQRNVTAVIGDGETPGLLSALRDKAMQLAGGADKGGSPSVTLSPDTVVYVVPGEGLYHLDTECAMEDYAPTTKEQAVADGNEPCDICVQMDLKTPVPTYDPRPRPTPIHVATLAPDFPEETPSAPEAGGETEAEPAQAETEEAPDETEPEETVWVPLDEDVPGDAGEQAPEEDASNEILPMEESLNTEAAAEEAGDGEPEEEPEQAEEEPAPEEEPEEAPVQQQETAEAVRPEEPGELPDITGSKATPAPTLSPQVTPTPVPVVTPLPIPEATPIVAPEIKPLSEVTVYYFNGSKYYHGKPTCGSMKNAPEHTFAEAVEAGKQKCPWCGVGNAEALNLEGTVVYCDEGNVFHVTDECASLKGKKWEAQLLEEAWMEDGMDGCPVCGAAALIELEQAQSLQTPVPAPVLEELPK